jgi:hypothetical protein
VPGAAALLQVVAAAGREPTAGETHALPALRTQPRVQPAAPAPRRGQPPVAIGAAVVLALLLAGWWLASRPVAPSVVLPSTVAPAPVAAASMPPPVTSPPTTVPPPPAFARESTVPRPKPTPRPPPERVDTLPAPPITVPVQATPAPLSTLPASVPSAQPPVPPSTQPAPAPVLLPELTGINPRSARRGVTVKLELRGRRLSRELQVLVLHGRRPVAGVRVLEQRFVDAERITLTLLVDADAPLDTYAIALRDAQGNISNSLPFEVAL